MQIPDDIIASAEKNSLSAHTFVDWCAKTGPSVLDASNALALQIAREYFSGRLDYIYCDRVMNSLMNAVTSEEFFAVSDRTVPKQLMLVYQAFDEGEYVHSGDQPDEDQEEKYTRPMIQSLLGRTSEA